MANEKARFEQSFLEAKRRELTALRDKLRGARTAAQDLEEGINAYASGEAREYEDDAQKLTTLELEGNLEIRDTARLVIVERALQKIEEGTYGLSDASGAPIPLERLEAVPEAIYTLAEQAALDRQSGAA